MPVPSPANEAVFRLLTLGCEECKRDALREAGRAHSYFAWVVGHLGRHKQTERGNWEAACPFVGHFLTCHPGLMDALRQEIDNA